MLAHYIINLNLVKCHSVNFLNLINFVDEEIDGIKFI